jgi:tetratricopeptide (TPR) repeat protein/CHAT domain-containing protein
VGSEEQKAMWKSIVVGVLILAAGPAWAQGPGRPTEAGRMALEGLARRCIDAGGLKEVPPADGKGPVRWAVADPAQFAATLTTNRLALTPAIRDALVERAFKTNPADGDRLAVVSFLRVMSEATGDRLASAFALLIGAMNRGSGGEKEAISSIEEAARLFEACKDYADQANCKDEIGDLHFRQRAMRQALEAYTEALEIRRAAFGQQHRTVSNSYVLIGKVYHYKHDLTRAIESYTKALEIRRAIYGEIHPAVADCYNSIAIVFQDHGDLAQALEGYTKALKIRRACLGERHSAVADSYNGIGIVCSKQGDSARALKAYAKSLEIYRAVLGDHHLNVAASYNNIANAYFNAGDLNRALEGYNRALEIRRTALGERHPAVARNYSNVAGVYHKQGELARALEAYAKVLVILRSTLGERHPDVAGCYTNIANVYEDMGELARALEGYTKALGIQRDVLGEHHTDVADSYNNIGGIYHSSDDFAQALESYNKALEIRRSALGERHPDVAGCYYNIAHVYLEQGELARALDMYTRALEIRRAALGERHSAVADSYNSIAFVYKEQGDLTRALEDYNRALEIQRTHLGEGHFVIGITYTNIATIYTMQGDLAQALEVHAKALEISRAALGERHPNVARSYLNIGNIYHKKGESVQALENYAKSLEIFRNRFGERHTSVADCYNNIGFVYAHLGDLKQALGNFSKALEIRRAAFGERHREVVELYTNIAIAYRIQGRPRQALDYISKAFDSLTFRRDSIESPQGQAVDQLPTLYLSALVLAMRGYFRVETAGPNPAPALRDALRDYQDAFTILERLREHVVVSEADKLRHGEDLSWITPQTIGVAHKIAQIGRTDVALTAAFEAAERGVARVLLESMGRAQAAGGGRIDPTASAEGAALAAKVRALDARIEKDQAKPIEKRDKDIVDRLLVQRREVDEAWRAFISRMERDFPQYAALKYPKACTVEEARACLSDDEVGLSFVPGSKASYLVVLNKSHKAGEVGIEVHPLPPSSSIAEAVSALLEPRVLEDAQAAKARGAEVFRMLLGPASTAIAGKSLVIVPGGMLGQLPFELLVEPDGSGGDGRFLVERHAIRYAPSMTTLTMVKRWEAERPKPGRALWAIGDPVYSASDPRLATAGALSEASRTVVTRLRSALRGEALDRLPGTGVEVERVASLMDSELGDRLTGPEATEAAVKKLSTDGTLADFRYVHFACHGILGSDKHAQPGLVLSLVGNPPGEDGFLRLDEVTGLRLNADLVVLSACQTGQGKVYRAEGVLGLARAFLYAGSRGVACSLWQVDDESPATLMADLYAGLKAGLPSSEALRQAQLKMIASGEPPLHWAPFVLIGR